MKTMTCKQLGGACDLEFHADNFDSIAEQSKKHGMEMMQKGDQAHINAMQDMQRMMQSPKAMQHWIEERKREFERLPDH
ncbi:DUF1059 domain-containing protein [bacterium]|nr:DUF1059 domain-containing protein [bacterium]